MTSNSPGQNGIENNGGGSRDFDLTARYINYFNGDYVFLSSSDNQAWVVGDNVNASASIFGGTPVAANLNPSDLIVTAGYTSPANSAPFPQTIHQVGQYSGIPEASSFLCVGAVALLMGWWKRRERVR